MTSNTNPEISIILTTCCVTEYRLSLLKLSMLNLLANTFMDGKELIICDNGDERQTEYLKTIESDKHLIFGENKGISYGRNAGAEASTGDYLCFIDNDLIYRPLWLRTLKKLLIAHNRKLIASGKINDNKATTYKGAIDHGLHWQIWNKTCSGCLLMKRQTWDEVGPWQNFWKLGTKFSRSAMKKGYRFIVPMPEVVAHLDSLPSYNKKKLRQEQVWQMKT